MQATKKSSAKEFVSTLLDEGSKQTCDDSSEFFQNQTALPEFYNEELFKAGQRFFRKHIFALLISKLMGLLAILLVPTILKILVMTKMSGSELSAYRRYLATLFHMCIWYEEDFNPDSKLWKSISQVKEKHNSASRKGCSLGLNFISQKDMALTQFGFMGFCLTRAEQIGVFGASEEELKGFVHVWKVIGYLMGVEDRFNICRDDVEETRAICEELIEKVFQQEIRKNQEEFLEMSTYLLEGMWTMSPLLVTNSFLNLLYHLLTCRSQNNNNEEGKHTFPLKLNLIESLNYHFITGTIYTLKFSIFRAYHNYVQVISLWLMKVFPFLAYYKFGKENSHVYVLAYKKNV